MDFFEVLNKRYSVRGYKKYPVEEEKLLKVLEAGRRAPTAANRQGFKIVVIRTQGREEDLKKFYGKDWFVEAPIVLGIFSIPEKSWVRSDGKNYSDVDAAIVTDHITLAATALGLGTCWVGAFDPGAAREIIGLGDGYEPIIFTPLGYPNSEDSKRPRKSLDDLVTYL